MEQQEAIAKLLSTPEGRKLFQLISGSGAAQAAGKALKAGDTEQVRQLMEPLLRDPALRGLLTRLEQTMNHG